MVVVGLAFFGRLSGLASAVFRLALRLLDGDLCLALRGALLGLASLALLLFLELRRLQRGKLFLALGLDLAQLELARVDRRCGRRRGRRLDRRRGLRRGRASPPRRRPCRPGS